MHSFPAGLQVSVYSVAGLNNVSAQDNTLSTQSKTSAEGNFPGARLKTAPRMDTALFSSRRGLTKGPGKAIQEAPTAAAGTLPSLTSVHSRRSSFTFVNMSRLRHRPGPVIHYVTGQFVTKTCRNSSREAERCEQMTLPLVTAPLQPSTCISLTRPSRSQNCRKST